MNTSAARDRDDRLDAASWRCARSRSRSSAVSSASSAAGAGRVGRRQPRAGPRSRRPPRRAPARRDRRPPGSTRTVARSVARLTAASRDAGRPVEEALDPVDARRAGHALDGQDDLDGLRGVRAVAVILPGSIPGLRHRPPGPVVTNRAGPRVGQVSASRATSPARPAGGRRAPCRRARPPRRERVATEERHRLGRAVRPHVEHRDEVAGVRHRHDRDVAGEHVEAGAQRPGDGDREPLAVGAGGGPAGQHPDPVLLPDERPAGARGGSRRRGSRRGGRRPACGRRRAPRTPRRARRGTGRARAAAACRRVAASPASRSAIVLSRAPSTAEVERRLVVALVRDPEAAAGIDQPEREARLAGELGRELDGRRDVAGERLGVEQVRRAERVDAQRLEPRARRRPPPRPTRRSASSIPNLPAPSSPTSRTRSRRVGLRRQRPQQDRLEPAQRPRRSRPAGAARHATRRSRRGRPASTAAAQLLVALAGAGDDDAVRRRSRPAGRGAARRPTRRPRPGPCRAGAEDGEQVRVGLDGEREVERRAAAPSPERLDLARHRRPRS